MEPVKFGKFTILDKIGQGGMAEIYKAVFTTADGTVRTVAIKKILPQYSSSEDFVSLMTDEARLMVTLNHPNIVPLIEFGSCGKDYYLALEYVFGKTVKDLLLKAHEMGGRIPFEVCTLIARELAQGLDYAHRKRDASGAELGIVHRDVSPTNILLSYNGEVKILDFGISRAASQTHVTHTGVIRGKMGYMSPEQTKSYLDIDGRSDVYSAGIILWELATCKRLYPSDNINEAVDMAREGNVPQPSAFRKDVPKELEGIILSALSREVSGRLQSAAIFRDLLNEFLAVYAMRKNYRKIFSNAELAKYIQHLFKEDYEKVKDELATISDENLKTMIALKGGVEGAPKEWTESKGTRSIVTNRQLSPEETEEPFPAKEANSSLYTSFWRNFTLVKNLKKPVLAFISFLILVISITVTGYLKGGRSEKGPVFEEPGLTVLSHPVGLKIFIDGRYTGLRTPARLKDLPKGKMSKISALGSTGKEKKYEYDGRDGDNSVIYIDMEEK